MFSRRKFIRNAGLGSIGAGLGIHNANAITIEDIPAIADHSKSLSLVEDESYWSLIRQFFPRTGNYIHLENGYCSPQSLSTLHFHQTRELYINASTSWYMRREMTNLVEDSRRELSVFLGVAAEEVAITRNTTESLNVPIMGYPWKPGDEVINGNQDYGSMNEAFEQAAKRYGIVVRTAEVPLHPASDQEVIDAYLKLATPKTKMLHLTHLINLSGQVIPVAAIADAARSKGIELVVVDAAHSIAQIDFKIPDLHADIVGASLHKWLCCPLGVGLLWVKQEWIPKIWPLFGDSSQPQTNIRRFEHQGTRPFQHIEAIIPAIAFHNRMGSSLKEARLKYLMHQWTSAVANTPGIRINTPWQDASRNSAIANVAVYGYSPSQLADALLQQHNIFSVAIDHKAIQGVRITPHLFNTADEVMALANALKALAKH